MLYRPGFPSPQPEKHSERVHGVRWRPQITLCAQQQAPLELEEAESLFPSLLLLLTLLLSLEVGFPATLLIKPQRKWGGRQRVTVRPAKNSHPIFSQGFLGIRQIL